MAHRACGSPSLVELGDDGTSIIADGPPDASSDVQEFNDELACILAEVNVPDFVISQIENTTALQGLKEATWDGIEAS